MEQKPPTSALVLLSGGQDSTTCLFWARAHFERVEAVGFDYGQKHAVELQQAGLIAERARVPFEIVDISGTLRGSALTEHDKDVAGQHDLNPDLPASFVPGRNALFLTIAAGYAYTRGIRETWSAACARRTTRATRTAGGSLSTASRRPSRSPWTRTSVSIRR